MAGYIVGLYGEDTLSEPLFFLGHRDGAPIFRINSNRLDAWEKALEQEGYEVVGMKDSYTIWGTYEGSYARVYDDPCDKMRIEVFPELSGSEFHKIGLKHKVIEPKGSRDRKYLAKVG